MLFHEGSGLEFDAEVIPDGFTPLDLLRFQVRAGFEKGPRRSEGVLGDISVITNDSQTSNPQDVRLIGIRRYKDLPAGAWKKGLLPGPSRDHKNDGTNYTNLGSCNS